MGGPVTSRCPSAQKTSKAAPGSCSRAARSPRRRCPPTVHASPRSPPPDHPITTEPGKSHPLTSSGPKKASRSNPGERHRKYGVRLHATLEKPSHTSLHGERFARARASYNPDVIAFRRGNCVSRGCCAEPVRPWRSLISGCQPTGGQPYTWSAVALTVHLREPGRKRGRRK